MGSSHSADPEADTNSNTEDERNTEDDESENASNCGNNSEALNNRNPPQTANPSSGGGSSSSRSSVNDHDSTWGPSSIPASIPASNANANANANANYSNNNNANSNPMAANNSRLETFLRDLRLLPINEGEAFSSQPNGDRNGKNDTDQNMNGTGTNDRDDDDFCPDRGPNFEWTGRSLESLVSGFGSVAPILGTGTETETPNSLRNGSGSGSGNGSRATGSDGERHSFLQNQMRGYLDEPRGWQKLRHELYPTTDLNVVTDGFSEADRNWLRQKLDARLAPTLERIFGIPPSAIRANDMFLIRYDGDRRASLSKHTDDGSITFSVLLSDGFEGGGTRYWNRLEANQGALGSPFAYLLPEVGMMQTFPAMIQHEGVQTTRGRRYLLIGFLAVDKIDPWTQHPTGLSWFSSWGSFNWVSTKLKEGKNAAWRAGNAGSGGFLDACYQSLVLVCDWVFPHRFAALVDSSDTDAYLSALDDAYQAGSTHQHRRGSWFAGQQIDVHIDGTFARNRRAREYSDVDFDDSMR